MLNKGILLSGKEKLYNVYRGTVSNVSLSYSPQTDIKAGTRVNITVNANSGYQNPSVSVTKNDGTGSVTVSGSGSSRYFTMPKSDVTINASASLIPTYSVSGSASGGGISFSKTSGIRSGETVTVYLSPNSYYVLSSLTSSPSVSFSGSGNTRTFKMPSSNVRVTATFVAPSVSGSDAFVWSKDYDVTGDGDTTYYNIYTLDIPNITLGNVYSGRFTCTYKYIDQNHPVLSGIPRFTLANNTKFNGTIILDTSIGTFSKRFSGTSSGNVDSYPDNLPNPEKQINVTYTVRLP